MSSTPEPSQASGDTDSPAIDPKQIPSASLATLIQILASQAMTAMGMIPGPDGKTRREPAIAKHFVDLLGVLEAKTKGNLDPQESRMLEGLLHDLRMTFVQVK